jgi:hypothetical protein
MVGERGAELVNFDNPARVYTAAQTREALSGGDNGELLAEIRALRAEVAALRTENNSGNMTLARHGKNPQTFSIASL